MAGVSPLPVEVSDRPRGPTNLALFSAVAELRWRLLVNSLRTIRGRLELASRVLAGFSMAVMTLGGAVFLAPLSYLAIAHDHPIHIGIALWVIFAFWQLYPLLGSLAAVPFEFATLLRFPMNFSTFWWLAFFYGVVDPVCLVSLFWLAAILVGIGVASPALLPGAVLALLVFALVNLFLSRAVYLWLDRWLARRKTREVLGVVLLFMVVAFQLLGPLSARWQRHSRDPMASLETAAQVARYFPPGLAAFSLEQMASGQTLGALLPCAGLAAYAAVLAALMNRRLRAQFLGENLSEAAAPVAVRAAGKVREGWDLPGVPGPIAAIFEKEARYLMRSGPTLFLLIMPVFVLLLFRLTPGRGGASSGILTRAPDWAFPVGAAYALLMLTNIVYHAFGADGCGLQLFLIAPVPLRDVLLAKNLTHSALFAVNTTLVLIATIFLYGLPRPDIFFTTLAALLFAFPLDLAGGNLLSVYSPKRYDLAAFGRQRTSGARFIGMLVHAFVFGISAVVIAITYHTGHVWLAGVIFLALAAISLLVYRIILNQTAQAAMDRREVLVAEICRVTDSSTTSDRIT